MAKWLKDYLSFGSKRVPPQPPKPDYTESEILKAYRAQKNLDFEDPYEDFENRGRNDNGSNEVSHTGFGSPMKSSSLDIKVVSPKHRLIKVDSQDLGRSKILLSSVSLEEPTDPVVPSAPVMGDTDYSDPFDVRLDPRPESAQGQITPENNGYMEPYEAQKVITGQFCCFSFAVYFHAPGGRLLCPLSRLERMKYEFYECVFFRRCQS